MKHKHTLRGAFGSEKWPASGCEELPVQDDQPHYNSSYCKYGREMHYLAFLLVSWSIELFRSYILYDFTSIPVHIFPTRLVSCDWSEAETCNHDTRVHNKLTHINRKPNLTIWSWRRASPMVTIGERKRFGRRHPFRPAVLHLCLFSSFATAARRAFKTA